MEENIHNPPQLLTSHRSLGLPVALRRIVVVMVRLAYLRGKRWSFELINPRPSCSGGERVTRVYRNSMSSEGRAPCILPKEYHERWRELAEWSCQQQHGPTSRYAIMYALTLRRSVLADRAHITYVSPHVWEVKDRLVTAQRIALFDDKLVESLLNNVDRTADFPTPLFPNSPCGSHRTDAWAHGLASRKLDRGHTNFQAISKKLNVAARPQWTPLEIYLVSLCVLRNSIMIAPYDECAMLMHQLGVQLPKNVFHHAHWFRMESAAPIGSAIIKDGQTVYEALGQ